MMENEMCELKLQDFASLFGTSIQNIPKECQDLIFDFNFRYSILDPNARYFEILHILKLLDSDLSVSGKNRQNRWEKGWNENLHLFKTSNYDTKKLIPMYYRRGKHIMRLSGNYILPEDPDFETNFLIVFIKWIAKTFLYDKDHIYEFGCGPAHNLLFIAELFPEKYYHGLDWAASSQMIIKEISESKEINIDGHFFDMFKPDETYKIEPNSALLTIGSMEQLGQECNLFFQYIQRVSPSICIHIEPIVELYDTNNLLDYLALKYSEKRGYLKGYYTKLKELENKGTIQILHVKKTIGSIYHDGWTLVVWKQC